MPDEDFALLTRDHLSALVRRHTHDVCNALNSVELELALLEETSAEPATREAVERMRSSLAHAGVMVRGFGSGLVDENPSIVSAFDLWQRWRTDARKSELNQVADWEVTEGNVIVNVGIAAIRGLLNQMSAVAVRLSRQAPLRTRTSCAGPEATYEIEPMDSAGTGYPPDPETAGCWGAMVRMARRHGAEFEPADLTGQTFPLRLRIPPVALPDAERS